MTRTEIFDRIYDAYCTWYDMTRHGEDEAPFAAVGEFHSTDSTYVLSRKVTVWSANSNDYLYVFTADTFTSDEVMKCIELARTEGEAKISPDKDHRSSYVTALFICDHADSAVVKAVKGDRYRKDFTFGLKGWEEVHTAVITVSDSKVITNGDGRNTAKFLKSIVVPKKKMFQR